MTHDRAIEITINAGIRLQLHTDSICTASQYLHRFYRYLEANPPADGEASHEYDTGVVVATSLYIATKTNENHVQLSELISAVHHHATNCEEEFELLPKDYNYWKLRDSVVKFELLMLRILGFDLIIDMPHKYLIFYFKSLSDWINNRPLVEELFSLSWSLLNDYFCHHRESAQWQPNQTALSCIELAIEIKHPLVKKLIENKQTNKPWYTNLDKSLKKSCVQQIMNQVMAVYQSE